MRDALLSFVINATWQAALIATLGLILARFLRPAQRFQLLALTLVAAVAAPALTLVPRSAPSPVVATLDLAPLQTRGGDGAIILFYLTGLAFVALRLTIAALHARRIAAASLPLRGRMRLSEFVAVPITIGRSVLLPPFVAGDRALRTAALAHEHAHVRRNDYLLHVALELIALPLYFHPLVLVLRRAIAEAREMACDDAAAGRCGRKEYAEALVRLASLAGRRHVGLGLGMAATSVERRVVALLEPPSHRASRKGLTLLIVPILAAAACTRFNVVDPANLCGHWLLVPEASDFRQTGPPTSYERFTQTIEQGPTRVVVHQQRTFNGRTRKNTWAVVTDGVQRPLAGARNTLGTAQWREGKLQLDMVGPGKHRESSTAFIRDGRLVVRGQTERGRYHAEFRRIDP